MRRALVVDDELDICMILTRHLRTRQFETHFALTVKDAFLKIDNIMFDLIFLDLNLTDGSGYEVIQYTNQLKLNPYIVVISAHESEASKAIATGATLFIKKPFTIKDIDEALKTLYLFPTIV